MNNFIQNVLHRHQSSDNLVRPRRKAIFESASSSPILPEDMDTENVKDRLLTVEKTETPVDILNLNSDGSGTLGKKNVKSPEPLSPVAIEFNQVQLEEIEESVTNKSNLEMSDEFKDPDAKWPFSLNDQQENTNKHSMASPGHEAIAPLERKEVQRERQLEKVLYKLRSKKLENQEILGGEKTNDLASSPVSLQTDSIRNNLSSNNELPSIKVHIGKVEIKAVKETANNQHKASRTSPKIKSLDQILQERNHK